MHNLWLRRFVLLVVHGLVALALVYGFHRYMPELTETVFAAATTALTAATTLFVAPGPSIDRLFRRAGGLDALLVAWFAILAYLAGKRFLQWVGAKPGARAEAVALSLAAGVALASLLVLVLAASKMFYRPVAYGVLVIPSVLWRSELWQLLREIPRLAARRPRLGVSYRQLAHTFLLLYVVIILALVYLSAVGPSWEYDDLIYHLAGPKNFVNRHGLEPLPDIPFTFFPKNIEMLYTLALAWRTDVTAKLVQFLLGLTIRGAFRRLEARGIARENADRTGRSRGR